MLDYLLFSYGWITFGVIGKQIPKEVNLLYLKFFIETLDYMV